MSLPNIPGLTKQLFNILRSKDNDVLIIGKYKFLTVGKLFPKLKDPTITLQRTHAVHQLTVSRLQPSIHLTNRKISKRPSNLTSKCIIKKRIMCLGEARYFEQPHNELEYCQNLRCGKEWNKREFLDTAESNNANDNTMNSRTDIPKLSCIYSLLIDFDKEKIKTKCKERDNEG
ncbi:hypothetical protein WA026_014470 [Henosepilachna vigintioctopunctata]|uniref:Uncharacterized protein n=1 Tax=Henosepilachna vigintioctopunctata TaxID=420089 RepID=A0AAW1UKQ3_9CUCU